MDGFPVAVIKFFDLCGRHTFFVLEARRERDLFGFCRSRLGPDGETDERVRCTRVLGGCRFAGFAVNQPDSRWNA